MFVVLDFETTSLAADRRATEIGMVLLDENLEIVDSFESLLNPGVPATAAALHISNLSSEEIADAPSFGDLWPQISAFLSGNVIVGHKVDFDLQVLRNEMQAIGLDVEISPSICTMELSKSQLVGQVDNFKLGTIAEKLGVELINAHEAINDVIATAALFKIFLFGSAALNLQVRAITSSAVNYAGIPEKVQPVPRERLEQYISDPEDFYDIAHEIKSNVKVQLKRIVGHTGKLNDFEEVAIDLLGSVGLHFKDTPTTQGTAFVVIGTEYGKTKIRKAISHGRPVIWAEHLPMMIDAIKSVS